jgi:hypothetical protein
MPRLAIDRMVTNSPLHPTSTTWTYSKSETDPHPITLKSGTIKFMLNTELLFCRTIRSCSAPRLPRDSPITQIPFTSGDFYVYSFAPRTGRPSVCSPSPMAAHAALRAFPAIRVSAVFNARKEARAQAAESITCFRINTYEKPRGRGSLPMCFPMGRLCSLQRHMGTRLYCTPRNCGTDDDSENESWLRPPPLKPECSADWRSPC